MNVLALCCTYYQLIVMMQIQKTIFRDDSITILLSDDSVNTQQIVNNLSKERVFFDVYHVEKTKVTKDNRYRYRRLKQFCYCINGTKEFSFLRNKRYDKFMFFNWDMYTYWIYAVISKHNKDISVSAFEEGLISYERACDYKKLDERKQYKLVRLFRKILNRPNICDALRDFYCFNPVLYKGDLHPTVIPTIDINDSLFVEQLCQVFELDEQTLKYNERFIYFTSLLDAEVDERVNGEMKIVLEVSRIVGIENMLVKVHPRDDKQKYLEAGLKVDENSSIPFELCQLIFDFSKHVFITTMSGAVLTVNSIVNNPAKVIFVYNLYEKRSDYIVEWSHKYSQLLSNLKSFHILEDCDSVKDGTELIRFLTESGASDG